MESIMTDSSSGRNEFNAGSDSAKHHAKGTASEQHARTAKTGASTPTVAPNGSFVRDQKPGSSVPGSAVKS
jgi:hypothetical protein